MCEKSNKKRSVALFSMWPSDGRPGPAQGGGGIRSTLKKPQVIGMTCLVQGNIWRFIMFVTSFVRDPQFAYTLWGDKEEGTAGPKLQALPVQSMGLSSLRLFGFLKSLWLAFGTANISFLPMSSGFFRKSLTSWKEGFLTSVAGRSARL